MININKFKNTIIVFGLMFLSLFFITNISFAEVVHTEKPSYVNFVTIGENDLYIDNRKNVFYFKNDEKEILVTLSSFYDYDFYDLEDEAYRTRKNNIDKDGDLILYINRDYQSDQIIKIDKDLNVEIISEDTYGFAIADGVLFYVKDASGGIYKYENNTREKLLDGTSTRFFIEKIDDKTFYLTTRKKEPEYYLYKDGALVKVDNNEINKIKEKVKANKIKVNVDFNEKIENYKKETFSEIPTKSEMK